ncbi:ATP synthase subunit I [Glaciecola siphonariae]|uniref:ATP synthase subunit I n=1 Tax=Glaciecola siphonariae TaxID=521012 RepID=A0ABV9LTE8_9ALTE
MKVDLASPGRKLAARGVIFQLCVGVVLVGVTGLFSPAETLSVLVGVIAFIMPHSFFAYWVFRYAGATKNDVVAQSMGQGMKIKLALTTVIFAIAFSQFNAHPVFLLGAYTIVMVSQWTAMVYLRNDV